MRPAPARLSLEWVIRWWRVLAKQCAANHSAPSLCGALSSCGRSLYKNFGQGVKLTEMERSIEKRYSIKFCVRLRKTPTETLPLIKEAYKDEALSKTQVLRWYSEFRNGRESVEDLERGGRPSTATSDETISKERDVLNSDRRLSLKKIAKELEMSHKTVHRIVTENLRRSSADHSLLRCFRQKSLLKSVHLSPDLQRSPGHSETRCASETPG